MAAVSFLAVAAFLLFSPISTRWQEHPSGTQCARNDFAEPTLVVISFDGFAANYLDLGITPNIEAIGRMGSRAQHIYSVFPARTFQNHYTMATGLWVESHGVVDNHIYDPQIADRVESIAQTETDGYYKGDPIWSAYKKQRGGITACLNWIGCGYNITGVMPDYNPPYNGSLSLQESIDQVLAWLSLEASARPQLVMAYLDQPDGKGHFRKNEAEIPAVLREADAVIDRLMKGIEALDMLDCANVLIVSDHGMANVTEHIYWNEHIDLDGLVALYGVIGRITRNGTTRSDESVTDPFKCSGGEKYRVYSRKTLPVKYHYASPRVGDYIFEGRLGTTFYADKSDDWFLTGDHGYNPLDPAMRTIFFARGPSIRQGVVLPPFQTVNHFNLFGDLLGMRPELVANNGTVGLIDEIFARPPPRLTTTYPISHCPTISTVHFCSRCCSSNVQTSAAARFRYCARTAFATSISSLTADSSAFCTLQSCGIEVIKGGTYSHRLSMPLPFCSSCTATMYSSFEGISTVVSEFLTPQSLIATTSRCVFETEDRLCSDARNQSTILAELLMTKNDEVADISRARTPLLAGFVSNFLEPLNALTRRYVQTYGRVAVITGTAYDADSDGRMDACESREPLPSHVFRILYTCPQWRNDGLGCLSAEETRPLTFILPHIPGDFNCLTVSDYLFAHSSRVRDVEELTGLRFFSDATVVPPEVAVKIRAHVPQKLWAA